jgi:(4S)-4-hydroxy-5-phosphonooxypentane-2,3-dione isomerase
MNGAFLVLVRVRVKPEGVEAFRAATLANVSHSRLEPGVFRFELLEEKGVPGSFLLIEGYRAAAAPAAHKATAHYAAWRDAVAALMAEPRTSTTWLCGD